jgi:uncharacterized protein with beta-barrel porin domain
VKAAYLFQGRGYRIVPDLYGKWLYDFKGEAQQTASSLMGGGTAFETRGYEPPASTWNLGARVSFLTADSVTLSLNYDLAWKEGFQRHSGYVSLRFAF